jgi:hypothetical protein
MIRKICRFIKKWKCVANKKQTVMCDVGGGVSVGRIPGRIPETRATRVVDGGVKSRGFDI